MFNRKLKQRIEELEYELFQAKDSLVIIEDGLRKQIEQLEKENKQLKKKLSNKYKGGNNEE